MKFLKKIARGLKKSAPMGAAAMVAKTVEPAIKKASPAPVGAIGTGMLPPPGAETGPAGKGFYTPPGAPVGGPVAAVGRGIGRGLKRMGFKDGGSVKASRSVVSSGRGDGAAIRGKTKCKMY